MVDALSCLDGGDKVKTPRGGSSPSPAAFYILKEDYRKVINSLDNLRDSLEKKAIWTPHIAFFPEIVETIIRKLEESVHERH